MTNQPPNALIETAPKRSWTSLVPVLALFAAAWFMAKAWDARGLPITIHFEAGHGLKAGDSLRFRGITAGSIDEVSLDPGLGGVDVRLTLSESSEALARAGSRFWVVRPRIGTGGLNGLDTLVGARYLDVSPGPSTGPFTDHFLGLETPPIIVPPGALELTLESDSSGSLTQGAPVTWRSIKVGRILSVGLSNDARFVVSRLAIDPEYAPLVRTTSRFFESGGLNLDFGLSGFHMEVNSIQALISGGVAFATPDEPAAPALTGQRFKLVSKPLDEWLKWRPSIPVGTNGFSGSMLMPQPERAQLSYESGLFNRTQVQGGWALWTSAGLIGPSDVLLIPKDDDEDDAASLEVSGLAFTPVRAKEAGATALLAGLAPPPSGPKPWPTSQMRRITASEDCLALADPNLAALAISALNFDFETKAVAAELSIDQTWHGAPVIARSDGALIGIIVVNKDQVQIAELPPQLLP